ncbi:unnamed protein product [Candidula unifasciata]|uniref:Major facilitator superfamily (MFS) profile domain-containing protein n=1 Tax=Candidula unifasciata TaxID=100452 RepID=A0A8S4A4U6_9EUPU|nr:unnamed protein product [Candidula unifasciata]
MLTTKSSCGCGRWTGVRVVVGGILIHLSLGTLYTFGNISPYLTSYMRRYGSAPSLTYTECAWIYALASMGQGVSMMAGGVLERFIGPKLTVLLGGWCMSLGVLLTFFSVKHSFALTVVTYGAVFGFGVGIAYAIPLGCVMRWFPKWKGLVNGVVVAGFGGGAFIFNQVQTAFINPDNLKPDVEVDGDISVSEMEDDITLKPAEVLRSRYFYLIWLMFVFNGQGSLFISTLYKAYGQTFISDDTFMALVGSFAAVFNAGGRIVWGTIADKFSFRVSSLIMCAAFTCLMLTLQLSERGGKPLFFIYICLLFGSFSGSFALFPTATAKCFGRKYLPINYGLVFTSQVITAPLGVFMSQSLKASLGWDGLFFLIAGFSFISFVLSILFNAKDKHGKEI